MSYHLKIVKLLITFEAQEKGELPSFLGSTIRGILGHAMRNAVCIVPDIPCHQCGFSSNCDYTTFFNTAGNIAGSVKPYVIHVPTRNKTIWEPGDLLTFELTIFGRPTLATEYYLNGILMMGEYGWGARRLKFSPIQIVNAINKSLIWSGGECWLNNFQPYLLDIEGRESSEILLRFNSPTRVVEKQKLQERLTFDQIIRSIMNRVSLLSHAYENVLIEWDEELIEKAKEIQTVEENWQFVQFERYSMTRKGKLELPSIEGNVRFRGDITPFTSLLEWGEIVQIGKNTTHGFGNYSLFYIE